MLDSIIKLVAAIVVFAFVLAVTYLTTRFIGNYQKQSIHGKNFDVIETYRLSPNKYLQILRIGAEYIVIAVCKDSVTMLCKLDEAGIELIKDKDEKKSMSIPSFSDMFEQMKTMKQNESKDEENEGKN